MIVLRFSGDLSAKLDNAAKLLFCTLQFENAVFLLRLRLLGRCVRNDPFFYVGMSLDSYLSGYSSGTEKRPKNKVLGRISRGLPGGYPGGCPGPQNFHPIAQSAGK